MSDVKSYQEMRQEFYKKYQETILPTVRKYEAERKENLKKGKEYSKILLVLGLLSLTLLFLLQGLSVFIAITLFGCSTIPMSIIKKSFEAKVKEKIMPVVCSCFGGLKWTNGLSYKPCAAIKISGIVSKYDSCFFDDIFVGSYKNVNYEIIEGTFDYGTGKNSKRVFSGVIIKLAMNKEFNSHTIITPELKSHKPPIKGLRHTVLEDIDFEKKFDVFTTDEVDARYLITTAFMERLKAMKTAFRATRTKCVFLGKHLLIALDTPKDLFSICSLDKPMDDPQQYTQMYDEIESIIKLIDYFKLDQKIGL